MSPMEKIAILSARLRRPAPARPVGLGRAHWATHARQRKLEIRRAELHRDAQAWSWVIESLKGNLRAIADRMGWSVPAARRAIWDLGLWPALVRARRTRDGVRNT